jgi:hypothetical protein
MEGRLMESNSLPGNDSLNDYWLRLLGLLDYCNHAIKQGEWFPEDVKEFYALKDMVMKKLYHHPPAGAIVTLKKVPYQNYRDCEHCSHKPEIRKDILIEMEIRYAGQIFCFHIPFEKTKDWGINIHALEHKEWLSSREFNRENFKGIFEEIRLLLDLAHGQEMKMCNLTGE